MMPSPPFAAGSAAMTIRTSCECGKAFELRDDFAGKGVRCPACGRIFEVPIPAALADDLSSGAPLPQLAVAGNSPATTAVVAPPSFTAVPAPTTTTNRGTLLAVTAVVFGMLLLPLMIA